MTMSDTESCIQWEHRVAEWVSETLTTGADTPVAAHVESCAACALLARELQAQANALRMLPAHQTSPNFEARLAGRLDAMDEAKRARSWRLVLPTGWRGWSGPARPALAFGAAILVFAGVVVFEHPAIHSITVSPDAMTSADKTLVLHCVEQHQTESSVQPLSDPAAQNLASKADDALRDTNAAALSAGDSL